MKGTGTSNASAATRATLVGCIAVLMWSTSVGLLRSISELLGPTGGAAAIYTASAVFAVLFFGMHWRGAPRVYLWLGGALFVSYEICLALAIGMASNRQQSLELGMINYLWPSLTIALAVLARQQRATWWLAPALALCIAGIVLVMKGEADHWTWHMLRDNVSGNRPAYALALLAAFLWAFYTLVARRYGKGANAVPLFLVATAALLWLHHATSAHALAMAWSWQALVQVCAMGLLTAIAYSCWDYAVQRGHLTLLATASYFTPVFSMLLASLWLGVQTGRGFAMGVALVTLGSLLAWRSTRHASSG